MILHITTKQDWENAKESGEYTTPSLLTEGFIHCSTVKQAANTANIFFKGAKDLLLLCIDETKLTSECKFEAPGGAGKHDPSVGNLFPHIYGPLNISAVTDIVDFPSDENGNFVLPNKLII